VAREQDFEQVRCDQPHAGCRPRQDAGPPYLTVVMASYLTDTE